MVTALLPTLNYEVKAEETKEMEIGDYVQFGRYWDDPIVWRIINKNDDGSLMLYSDKILCLKAFDANGDATDGRDDADGSRVEYGSNNWERSNLREWLNSEDAVVQYSHQKPDSEHLYNYDDETLPGYNPYDSESGFLSNFTKAERDVIQPFEHKVILSEVDKDIKSGGFEEYSQQYVPAEDITEGYVKDVEMQLLSFLYAGQNFYLYASYSPQIKLKIKSLVTCELHFEGDSVYLSANDGVHTYELTDEIKNIDGENIYIRIIDSFTAYIIENVNIGAEIKIINNSGRKINIYHNNYTNKVKLRDRDGKLLLGDLNKENVILSCGTLTDNYENSYYKNLTDRVFLLDSYQLKNYVYNRGWEYQGIPTWKATLNSDYKSSLLTNQKRWYNWILMPGISASRVRLSSGLGQEYYQSSLQDYDQEVSFNASDGDVGVCPALVLKAGVKASGGDGSVSDPFVVHGEEGFESPITRTDVGSIPLTSNYVIVADYYTKKPIAGASVMINNQIIETDANGMAELGGFGEGKHDLDIQATDYRSHACVYDLKLGNVELFFLKPDKQFLEPYITKINLNDGTRDYDLLRQVKEYRKISSDSDIKFEDYCCIKMEAERRGKTVKYILSQGWDTKLESVSGQFDAVAIGKVFEPGKKIYAMVQAEDGTTSEPIETNLSVFSSRFEGSLGNDEEFSIRLGKETGVTIPGNLPVIGGTEINFGFDDIPLTYSQEGNTFKIAFGLKKEAGEEDDEEKDEEKEEGETKPKVENVTKSKESWAKLKKTFDQFKKDLSEYKQFRSTNKLLNAKKSSLSTVVGWDTEAEVCGYIEGVINKNGTLIVSEGSLLLSAGFKASKSMQYIVGPVPVFLAVEGGIKVETLSEITRYILESGEVILNTDLKFIPHFELEGGVGVVGVCTVSASGEAELEFLLKYPENYTKISLTGKMNIKAKALIFEAKKEIARGTWNIYEGSVSKSSRTMMGSNNKQFNVYDANNYSVMPREYIDRPSIWRGDSKTKRMFGAMFSADYSNKDVKTLQTNIFPDAQPLLGMVGDKKVMVWLADNPDRTLTNRTMLVYSIYDSETDTWSSPIALHDDNTADFYPSMASDNSNLYLVWQNSNKVFNESVTLEEAAASGEISVAKFNTSKNAFEGIHTLTNDNVVDTQPQIAIEGGKAFVAWSSNTENNLFGNSGQNTIYYSELDGETWTKPIELVNSLNAVVSLDAGYMDGSFRVAYVRDQDNDLETIDDRDIFIAAPDQEIIKLTDNQIMDSSPVFANFDGSNALYWYNDNNISYLTSISETTEKIFDEAQNGIRDDFEVVNNYDGKTAVIWTTKEEDATEISAAIFDKDKDLWSEVVKISDLGSIVQFPSGVFDENGNFNIAFNKLTSTEEGIEQSDLCTIKVTPSYNLSVNSVSFDPESIIPGQELPLEIEVENKGELRVDQMKIEIGDESENIQNVVETIMPGETKTINAVLKLDEIIQKKDYTVTITPIEGNEFDLSDNKKEFTVGYSDIALSVEQYSFEDSEAFVVNLSNLSHTRTGAILKIKEDSIDGKVIDTKEIPILVNGSNISYIYEIDKNSFSYNEGIKQYYFVVEAEEDEVLTGDNSDFIVLSKPIPDYVYGDVTGDGLVNSIDFAYMRQYLIGMRKDFPSTYGKAAADVTGDGNVNSIDFAYMRQYLIGMIKKFPVEKE